MSPAIPGRTTLKRNRFAVTPSGYARGTMDDFGPDLTSTSHSQADPEAVSRHFDVAVIGAGSAGEALAIELASNGRRVVVFEPGLVGGECPFVACMPTKAMLHDGAIGRSWADSIRRRADVVEHLDDSQHAHDLRGAGATLVRHAAHISADGTIEADSERYAADDIVIATGSDISMPPIDGLDELGDRCWTSADAMTTDERPTRLAIVGGGVIGCELATIFARFGSEVHLLDAAPTAFPDLPPEIGDIVDDVLGAARVRVRRGIAIDRVSRRGGGVRTAFETGACLDTDRLLIATGTQPRSEGLGFEHLGVDPKESGLGSMVVSPGPRRCGRSATSPGSASTRILRTTRRTWSPQRCSAALPDDSTMW